MSKLTRKTERYFLYVFISLSVFFLARRMTFFPVFTWQVLSVFGIKSVGRRSIEKLLSEQNIDLCSEVLLILSGVSGKIGVYARKRIFDIACWKARHGFLLEGEALIGLLPITGGSKGQFLIRFWSKYALFNSETEKKVESFLHKGGGGLYVRHALKMLWMLSDDSERVAELYGQKLEHLDLVGGSNRRIFSEGLSVLLSQNRLDEVRMFANESSEKKIIYNKVINYRKSFCDDRSSLLYSCISNPEVKIAVVGNSSVDLRKGKGREIDSHDIVIRFNKFKLDQFLSQDYGTKTTVVASTKSVFTQVSRSYPRDAYLFLLGEDPLNISNNIENERNIFDKYKEVISYPRDFYRTLLKLFDAAPSSGLQVIYYLLRVRGNFTNVDFYGFSFIDQIGKNSVSSSYFSNTKPSFRHNWIGERRYIDDLLRCNSKADIGYSQYRYDAHLDRSSCVYPVRIKLIGDHSSYHCGCRAVFSYLKNYLVEFGVLVNDSSYDVLVVNGEGSMHHDSLDCLKKLAAMQLGLSSNKKVALINTVWQENTHKFDSLLKRLSFVSVREVLSQDSMLNHGVSSACYLDCSFWAPVDNTCSIKNYLNKPVVTDFYSIEFKTFVRLTGGLESKYEYIDMKRTSWSSLVNSLKTASVLITGRHHAVYAACRAEIPFVVMRGNTHKIEGLIKSSGIDIPICKNRSEINSLIEWVDKNRHVYELFFNWMKSQPRFEMPDEIF